ncbi:hypothetical protein C8046_13565 [Serinibacter arcticus]|uniref:Imm33-like domain-containing protein n=1 Tax=Serinibacter arcticus TaxID=1655435 RepID=A0A2U1ZX28_9MICO|nr:hypothetical protein [Serinibacter arcticus]PWD51531.1 hypothetical protein C8046_13565 [Serinibacter arcticus]
MTDPNGTTQHWTEGFPHLTERAAALLRIDPADVARHSQVVPGAFHVWTPGRGGPHAILGFDGTALVRESTFTQAQLHAAYTAGQRNDEAVAREPIMHAGSAVAILTDVLGGRERRTISAVGPTEDELAALGHGPFALTTPDEIATRLRGRGEGSWTIVGIDRAAGPGHWLIALHQGDQIHTFDPVANARGTWPPETGAIRWWANGRPEAPPSRVVVDARHGSGRRIWVETTPALAPTAQQLVSYYAGVDGLRNGLGVWNGFWWAVAHEDGQDLRIAVTDLTKPGIAALTWDADPAFTLLQAEHAVAHRFGVDRAPVRFVNGVRLREAAIGAAETHLVRRTPAPGTDESGWLVTTAPDDDGADAPVVPAHELWRRAPHLVPLLALPVGFHVVAGPDEGGTVAVRVVERPAT